MNLGKTGLRFCACVLVLVVFAASVSFAAPVTGKDEAALYYNETRWDGEVPCVVFDDEYFIPIDLFSCVPYINLSVVTEDDAFVIRNENTGNELSVLCAIEMAWMNGTVIDFAVHKISSGGTTYFYVNADSICRAMGLDFDVISARSGGIIARIRDSASKMPFERFLKVTVPSAIGQTAFDEPLRRELSPNTVFLTFCGINEYTDAILDVLAENNMTACFFLSQEDLANIETVIRIASLGFRIGIDAASHEDALYADETNMVLYDIILHKTHFIKGYGNGLPNGNYIDCTETVVRRAYGNDYDYINACAASDDKIMALYQNEWTVNFLNILASLGIATAELPISR